jgi:CBS domain-containing protein
VVIAIQSAAELVKLAQDGGMKHNVPVSKIMSANPITIHHGDPISKVRKTFVESGVHHLPVVSGEKLVGIVSWTDMMRISFGESFGQDVAAEDAVLDHTHTLEDLMAGDPVTIESTSPIREAAEQLSEANFHALPVVEGGNLVGIVTTQDLIRYLRDLY